MSISSVTTNYKWTIQKQIIYSLVGSELMPHHLERVQEVLKHCISLPYLQKFIKKHDIGLGYIPRVLGDRCTFQKLIKTSTQCQIFGGKQISILFRSSDPVFPLDFKVFGGHLYAFYENGELVTLNLRSEAIERTRLADKSQHEDSFPLFSEKGSFLIVRDIENGVRIYDYQKREFLTEWIHFDRFTLIAVFESPFGKSVVRGVVNGHGVIFYDGVKLIGVDHLDSLSTYRTDSHVSVVLNTYHQTILNVITTISKPFTSLIFLMESPLPLVDQGFGEINDGRGSFFFQDKDDFIFVLSPNHLLQLFNLQGDCLKKIQFERLFQDEQVEKMTVQGNLIYSQTVRISKSHFGEKVKRIIIHSPSGRCLASLPMDSSDHLERIQVVGTRIFLLMKNSRPGPRIQVFKFSKK